MTTSSGKTLEEAAKAVKLHKIHPENFFSELDKPSTFEGLCSGVEHKAGPKSKEAKELCIKLVRSLEKISKENDSQRNNYCSYIRYWLYEQISEIHTNKSAKITDVRFFDDLILAWKIINNGKLKNKCNPENIKDVKLDELKNRIFSYIYFKNLEKIKTISTSKKQDDCTKYLTYLESFKSVHDGYKDKQCKGLIFWSSQDTDYFPCKDSYKLSSFMSELQKCKNGNKPDPKALPAGKEKDKVVEGKAPLGGQKGSEDTAGPKASVVATSSSSSSHAATTSTVSSPVATTQPGKTTTTTSIVSTGTTVTTVTTASAPLTVTPVTTTKASPTVTAATTRNTATTTNTVTTTSTRSSSSQGRPSLFSFLLGPSRPTTSERASSLGASQTSSSSSRALGSRASGSSVITTSTPSARGSISSTGQVGQGGLTRAPAAAAVTEKSLSPPSQGSPGYALNPVSSYNSNTGGDTNLETITDVPGTSERLYDKLDSNTVKNIIMAAAVLGIIFFLFYYNRSSRIESSIKPKKRKKKAFEHNYYEEYEKELAKYESENESLDSLEDRYYLTYQPDQDSYY